MSARRIFIFSTAVFFAGCASASHTPQDPSVIYVSEGKRTFPTLPSSSDELKGIGNVHELREDGRILRGASPKGKAAVLKKGGVTDVLIVRNSHGDDIDLEKKELSAQGIAENHVHHVPMKWREIESQELACREMVQALQVFESVEKDPKKKLFVHCTVGEDRTGTVAGLYRMTFQNWGAKEAFQNEMCARGFAEGNPRKPEHVTQDINESLKPVFAQVAARIESKQLRAGRLSPDACAQKVNEARVRELSSLACAR